MSRYTRYQGLIIRDHHVLVIKHLEHSTGRSYWVIPGGGLEGDEPEAAARYSISEVAWFDLRDESTWATKLIEDSITYPQLARLRRELGYSL